jgi:hypothetical protein
MTFANCSLHRVGWPARAFLGAQRAVIDGWVGWDKDELRKKPRGRGKTKPLPGEGALTRTWKHSHGPLKPQMQLPRSGNDEKAARAFMSAGRSVF